MSNRDTARMPLQQSHASYVPDVNEPTAIRVLYQLSFYYVCSFIA